MADDQVCYLPRPSPHLPPFLSLVLPPSQLTSRGVNDDSVERRIVRTVRIKLCIASRWVHLERCFRRTLAYQEDGVSAAEFDDSSVIPVPAGSINSILECVVNSLGVVIITVEVDVKQNPAKGQESAQVIKY